MRCAQSDRYGKSDEQTRTVIVSCHPSLHGRPALASHPPKHLSSHVHCSQSESVQLFASMARMSQLGGESASRQLTVASQHSAFEDNSLLALVKTRFSHLRSHCSPSCPGAAAEPQTLETMKANNSHFSAPTSSLPPSAACTCACLLPMRGALKKSQIKIYNTVFGAGSKCRQFALASGNTSKPSASWALPSNSRRATCHSRMLPRTSQLHLDGRQLA